MKVTDNIPPVIHLLSPPGVCKMEFFIDHDYRDLFTSTSLIGCIESEEILSAGALISDDFHNRIEQILRDVQLKGLEKKELIPNLIGNGFFTNWLKYLSSDNVSAIVSNVIANWEPKEISNWIDSTLTFGVFISIEKDDDCEYLQYKMTVTISAIVESKLGLEFSWPLSTLTVPLFLPTIPGDQLLITPF